MGYFLDIIGLDNTTCR